MVTKVAVTVSTGYIKCELSSFIQLNGDKAGLFTTSSAEDSSEVNGYTCFILGEHIM